MTGRNVEQTTIKTINNEHAESLRCDCGNGRAFNHRGRTQMSQMQALRDYPLESGVRRKIKSYRKE
jgi:hypothetical protein